MKNTTISFNDLWNENVEKAKTYLRDRKKSQLAIAALALGVCEVSWGGNSKTRSLRTLNNFAKEIGVNEKTLSSWCATKKNIYDKLEPDLKFKAKWHELFTAARIVPANCSVKEANDAVFVVVNRSGPDTKILRYLSSLCSLIYNLDNPALITLAKKETLEEALYWSDALAVVIHKHTNSKLKPKNHHLTQRENRSVSLADSMGVSRVWRMTESDQLVLDYLKKKSEYLAPIKIYTEALPKMKMNAAKLRTLRSLNKLKSMGHIMQNENGLYKIKNQRI